MSRAYVVDAEGRLLALDPARHAVAGATTSAKGKITLSVGAERLIAKVDLREASDKALNCLIREIAAFGFARDKPVFIDEGDAVVRRYGSSSEALHHLVARLASQSAPAGTAMARNSISFSDSHSSFLQLKAMSDGNPILNFGALRQLLFGAIGNRYCVVRPCPESNRLVLAEFGDGYHHIDNKWEQRTAGTPFGEFEDQAYSSFVKEAYREVWSAWRPVVEEIHVPQFSPPLPARYQRLLLPVILGTGPALLSASIY